MALDAAVRSEEGAKAGGIAGNLNSAMTAGGGGQGGGLVANQPAGGGGAKPGEP